MSLLSNLLGSANPAALAALGFPGLNNLNFDLLGSPNSPEALALTALAGNTAGAPTPPTLQELVLQGYTPEEIEYLGDVETINLGPSALQGIDIDPGKRAMTEQTLASLDEQSRDGLTAIDRARLAEINAQQSQEARGQREAITQNLRQRGMAGSGMELAALLEAQQSGANQASMQGLQTGALAEQARREAALQKANLAEQLISSDYGRDARAGEAADAIAQFNAMNAQNVALQNRNLQQQIAQLNAQNQTQANQANANVSNMASTYNVAERPVQQFNMATGQAQTQAQGLQNLANLYSNQQAQQYGANTQLVGTGLQTLGQIAGAAAKPKGVS